MRILWSRPYAITLSLYKECAVKVSYGDTLDARKVIRRPYDRSVFI